MTLYCLSIRLLANGIQGLMFSVLWRYFMDNRKQDWLKYIYSQWSGTKNHHWMWRHLEYRWTNISSRSHLISLEEKGGTFSKLFWHSFSSKKCVYVWWFARVMYIKKEKTKCVWKEERNYSLICRRRRRFFSRFFNLIRVLVKIMQNVMENQIVAVFVFSLKNKYDFWAFFNKIWVISKSRRLLRFGFVLIFLVNSLCFPPVEDDDAEPFWLLEIRQLLHVE